MLDLFAQRKFEALAKENPMLIPPIWVLPPYWRRCEPMLSEHPELRCSQGTRDKANEYMYLTEALVFKAWKFPVELPDPDEDK